MKVYIEWIVLTIIFLVIFLFWVFSTFTRWRLKKKYKPEDDKSKKGGESNARDHGTKPRVVEEVRDNVGLGEPERQPDLPEIPASGTGKNSSGNRKNGTGTRKLLKRRRRTN